MSLVDYENPANLPSLKTSLTADQFLEKLIMFGYKAQKEILATADTKKRCDLYSTEMLVEGVLIKERLNGIKQEEQQKKSVRK